MTESEYWLRLEFRLESEFAGLAERRLRHYWCDGFIPQQYLLEQEPPCITGRAWICHEQETFELWDFALFLDRPAASLAEVDWASMLPAANVTRWLAFDPVRKCIEIDPSAAVPDLA